jgi:hypothetical protein
MATYFADKAVQPTPGDRGKTTRRKSTRTVRGPEGAYIAQVKEELTARPAGWLVKYRQRFSTRFGERVTDHNYGRFDTEAEAVATAATLPTGPASLHMGQNGTSVRLAVWVEREVK